MFGVSLQHADHLQSAEIAQGFSQFQRAVRAGQQSQSVEALALFRVGERGGDTFAPLLLGVAVRVGGAVDRDGFDLMQNGGIGQFRQSGEVVIERIAVDSGLAYHIGNGDFAVVAVGE